MKILGVSPLQYSNKSSYTTNNINNFSTELKFKNGLSQDTVSFKKNENKTFFDEFGLLQKENNDKNPINIKDYFDIDSKESYGDRIVLNTFKWNMKNSDKPALFYGKEKDFAKALESKKINAKNFEVINDESRHYISYKDKNVHYCLTYDKSTGTLEHASADTTAKGNHPLFERIDIKPSAQKPNSYIVNYKFMQKIDNDSAIEDTYLVYDAGKNVPEASYTTKYIYRKDTGFDKKQEFVKIYDKNGFSENSQDLHDMILY